MFENVSNSILALVPYPKYCSEYYIVLRVAYPQFLCPNVYFFERPAAKITLKLIDGLHVISEATMNSKIKNCIYDTYNKEMYKRNPTCYFYSLTTIQQNIEQLQKHFPSQISLYYAMKANSNQKIMEFISRFSYVKGFEIASEGELKFASKYRPSHSFIFTGPGKTEFELEEAIKHHIQLINVESIVEAIRINQIAKRLGVDHVDVLIRINLDYSIECAYEHMSGCSTKMGIDEKDYAYSFKMIRELGRINIKGIHVFAASGVLDYSYLIKSQEYIFKFVKRIEPYTGEISVIDFGGGIGIDYTNEGKLFDLMSYSAKLKELINKYGFQNKCIIMELGTYLVGNAGYYTAMIIDIKEVKQKKHIIIAGGVNHMGLPLEMRRKHPVTIIPMNAHQLYGSQPFVHNEVVDISGPLCMVTDKLSWDEYIESAEIGDIVVFRQAGAYCYGEGMHDFLMHERPDELIIQ